MRLYGFCKIWALVLVDELPSFSFSRLLYSLGLASPSTVSFLVLSANFDYGCNSVSERDLFDRFQLLYSHPNSQIYTLWIKESSPWRLDVPLKMPSVVTTSHFAWEFSGFPVPCSKDLLEMLFKARAEHWESDHHRTRNISLYITLILNNKNFQESSLVQDRVVFSHGRYCARGKRSQTFKGWKSPFMGILSF